MAQTDVTVVEVLPDRLKVQGLRSGGCKSCDHQNHCAVKAGEVNPNKSFTLYVPYQAEQDGMIALGQQVAIQCHEQQLLQAVATLFAPPLLGLVLLPALWQWGLSSAASDGTIAICAMLGLLTGLAVSRQLARRWRGLQALSAATIKLVTKPTKSRLM